MCEDALKSVEWWPVQARVCQGCGEGGVILGHL